MRIRAFIVDSSYVARRVLWRVLQEYNDGADFIELAGETGGVDEAVYMASKAEPNVMFICVEPDEIPLLASQIGELKEALPELKVIFCANPEDSALVEQAWQNGADDFVVKPYRVGKVHVAVRNMLKPQAAKAESGPGLAD